jgi:uncharacterized repeat protein (TIGR03803 family)
VHPNVPSYTLLVHNFADTPSDPGFPYGPLVAGPVVPILGTELFQWTYFGLTSSNGSGNAQNSFCGAVYGITSPPEPNLLQDVPWPSTVMHSFTNFNGADGCGPTSLVRDSSGTLFGTTLYGGANGQGTVFSIAPGSGGSQPVITTLYSFQVNRADGSFDGTNPTRGMIIGADGNLYGTTQFGGQYGLGTVFEVVRPAAGQTTWNEITLHEFSGSQPGSSTPPDGAYPQTGVAQDMNGTLYGVTYQGGGTVNPFGLTYVGAGAIFSLNPATGTESILYKFAGPDGAYPLTKPVVFNTSAGAQLMGTTNWDSVTAGGLAYMYSP